MIMRLLQFILAIILSTQTMCSMAHCLGSDELQAYHNYLQKALRTQDHNDFKNSLIKVKKHVLKDIQAQNKNYKSEELVYTHNEVWMSILTGHSSQNQNLLTTLLSKQNIPMRPEKFTMLIDNGLFYIDSDADLSWTYNNLNYQYFEDYLIHQSNDDDPDLLHFLMSFLTHEQGDSWTPSISNYQKYKKKWLKTHYLEMIDSLLRHNHFEAAAFLIEQLPSYDIPYLLHFEDLDLNISIRCYAPVMESILSAMDKLYTKFSNFNNLELRERLGEVHIFDAFSKDLMQSRPFSHDALERFNSSLTNITLNIDSDLLRGYKSYIHLGQIRNHFLGIYSRILQLELAGSEQPKRFFYELIAYLHSENPVFEHLFSFQGFEFLFLNRGGNGEDFLSIALNRFDIYMFSILLRNIPPESLGDKNDNLFHHLLAAVSSSPNEDTFSGEARCLRIVRFILFAYQIDIKEIIKYLRQKNRNGETPLFIAAHKGLFRVFFTLKRYLSNRGYFSEDEHSPPYFLDSILQRGLEQRMQLEHSQEMVEVHERLKAKIDNRSEDNSCLSPYSDKNTTDARHQSLIVDRIKFILAQPIPPKKDPAKYLYPYAFSQLIKHYFSTNFWFGAFKDFSQAPASIQMSYLKEPISLIINKIIFNYSKGRLDATSIMIMLHGRKHNHISKVLEELILEHIDTLLAEDPRKHGQW